MASSQHHGRCICSDLSVTGNRASLMVDFPDGSLRDFRLSLALWRRSPGASTPHPPSNPTASEVSHAELSSVLRNKLNPHKGYEQIVSNAAKELSDPLAEIVLDARARGRYEPRRLTSISDSTPCADIPVQTLNPRGSPLATCRIRSLFHSMHFCKRTRATLAGTLRHTFLQTSFVEG
jgi:hypothetical protein